MGPLWCNGCVVRFFFFFGFVVSSLDCFLRPHSCVATLCACVCGGLFHGEEDRGIMLCMGDNTSCRAFSVLFFVLLYVTRGHHFIGGSRIATVGICTDFLAAMIMMFLESRISPPISFPPLGLYILERCKHHPCLYTYFSFFTRMDVG